MHTELMGDANPYAELPSHVSLEDTIEAVDPYEAVEPIRGARRVSPYSPLAEIDAARLHAQIATDERAEPWRRRLARVVVLFMLASIAFSLLWTQLVQWRH